MPSFDFNWDALGDLAVEEFQDLASDVLEQVTGEQKERVFAATRQLTAESIHALADPANAMKHRRNIEFLLGTLENEAKLAEIFAARRARQAVSRVIMRVTGVVLGALA